MSDVSRKTLTKYARQLRREMTPWERKLWFLFLRRYPLHVYKQRVMGPYIVDFFCPAAKLVIELDGSQHFEEDAMAYDASRDAYFEELDIRVLRFANIDVDRRFEAVCAQIDQVIRARREELGGRPLSQQGKPC